MRLMKTALFVFGLAGVFFITGNSFAQNGMHQHGQAMMGMQTQDSTVTMHGNTMMQPGTMHQHGQNMMGMQNDSTGTMPGNTMMQSGAMQHQGHMMMNVQNQDSTAMMQGQSMMEPNQTICPVMGGKIDKKFFADYKSKRVYFCCESCLATFKKNPDKYMRSMEKQGIRLENTPKSEKSGT